MNKSQIDVIAERHPPKSTRDSDPGFHMGLGWMLAECCSLLQAGKDPRHEEIGGMVERAEKECSAVPRAEKAFDGWYCAHCQRGVDASEVTFNEQHTECGRVITSDEPPTDTSARTPMESLTAALQRDPAYAHGWHCNIAMACADAMTGVADDWAYRVANDTATRFMALAFGVKTSRDMLDGGADE